ncbi:hypothetical protein PHYPSEUDO_007644 [Phytophthora pseudosyringae]|uniref:Uncharacterized protein n=1 Tax=Phytophthora pseudosyringae TaxID=221518 RepID=A0A8T1VJ00_9STRA|nr:hypothetical protein PHYPSEUDO_007644 [Phytophthora pseudosyringae]
METNLDSWTSQQEDTETEMTPCVHVAGCRFLRLGCRSDEHELFRTSYARSNKKRSSKVDSEPVLEPTTGFRRHLLRCFPHCCPDHVPRSYCGCSLHVLVTFAAADEAAVAYENDDDVVVCARFESAAAVAMSGAGDVVTALPTDSIVALPVSALQPSGMGAPTDSDWMRADKAGDAHQQQFPANTILYVLNNHRSPEWYYGYESGSTKAQREMKHVLATYVFLLHPLPRESISSQRCGRSMPVARIATVASRYASSSFTMISYRRQKDGSRAGRDRVPDRAGMLRVATAEVVQSEQTTVADTVRAVLPQSSLFSLTSVGSEYTVQQVTTSQARAVVYYGDNFRDAVRWPASHPPRLQSQTATLNAIGGWTSEAAMRAAQPPFEPEPSPSSLATPLGLPSPRPTLGCPICREPLGIPPHNLHRSTVEQLQPLLLLQLFMRFVPLDAFSFYFAPMDFRIQRRWLAKIPPAGRMNSIKDPAADVAARALVADVASSFSLKNFLAGQPHPEAGAVVTDLAREQMLLRSCADLLLDAFSSPRVQQILLSATEIAAPSPAPGFDERRHLPSPFESCEQFCEIVSDLSEELSQLLMARNINNANFSDEFQGGRTDGPASIAELIDDILSLVYAETKYRALRGHASALLLRKDSTVDVAVQNVFYAFVAQQRQARDPSSFENGTSEWKLRSADMFQDESQRASTYALSKAGGPTQYIAVLGDPRSSTVLWNRRWFLVPTSVFITPLTSDVDVGNSHPSLLIVVATLRMFASIDVKLQSSSLTVAAVMSDSSFQPPARSSMTLQLDGQVHGFTSLPTGLSATATAAMFGVHWGLREYEGRVGDDGASVDLLLHGAPYESQTADQLDFANMSLASISTTATAHKLRVRLTLEDTGEVGGDCLSVIAEISGASSSEQHASRTATTLSTSAPGSVSGVSEVKWTPTMEVVATYIGV